MSHLITVDHDLHQVEPLVDHYRIQERLLEPLLQKPSSTNHTGVLGLVDSGVEGEWGEGNTLRPAMALVVSLMKVADERSSRQNLEELVSKLRV